MSLGYSYIDWTSPVPVPPRMPNGGLYTGEVATGNWGNFPVEPEAHVLTTKNILTANPPPQAIKMAYSENRPGNNAVQHPYHTSLPDYQFKVIRS